MRSLFLLLSFAFLSLTEVFAGITPVNTASKLIFLENSGQIRDQNGNARSDIQFVLPGQGINIFIGNGQLHYQFCRTVVEPFHTPGTYIKPQYRTDPDIDRYETVPKAEMHTYRLDVALVGANTSAGYVVAEPGIYFERYYLPGSQLDGIKANSFRKITYKNIYPDIDWVIYINGNTLEHEFIVGSSGDASLIKVRYSGQTSLAVGNDGSITATTPMGTVTERAPVCYSANGTLKQSSYMLNGNTLSYKVQGEKEAVLIDPILQWGTFYGPDSSTTNFYDVAAYDTDAIYSCGLTYSGVSGTIATVGAFQSVFGGETDAFLVKFDSSGVRKWCTYYGGSGADWGTGVACSISGMIYMCGNTASSSGMSTPGSTQSVFGGLPYDAFVAKFAPDGTRIWCTYAGGPGANYPWSVSCDKFDKVYLAGDTNESTSISTPSGHKPVKSGGFDWYLIQYDTLGAKIWGTYYGGAGDEFMGSACTDTYQPYLTGWTPSTTGIATGFSHQSVNGGGNDAAVVKFFENGLLSWGSYYGGTASENVGGVACDRFLNVYLFGTTESDNNISTPGSYQPVRSGLVDGFLVKFTPEAGARAWATYFGGPLTENADLSRICTDDSANIYIIGTTESTTGVATDTAWQPVFGGGVNDAFLAKFNTIGALKWSTYYGGENYDQGRGSAFFGEAVYICGQTNSTTNISTPDAFQPTGAGLVFFNQGFVAKFADPDTTSIPEDTSTVRVVTHNNSAEDLISLQLYPNPNSGKFHISGQFATRNGIAEITITDLSGRILVTDKFALHNGVIKETVDQGATLPPGVYILKVATPGISRTITFSKE